MRTLLSLVLVGGLTSAAHALPGDLDTSFNGVGKVITNVPGNGNAAAVAVQADGKILVAGSAAGNFIVLRYTAGGSLDSTFGGDGIVTTDFGGPDDGAAALAIQEDGRIVVAGFTGDDDPAVLLDGQGRGAVVGAFPKSVVTMPSPPKVKSRRAGQRERRSPPPGSCHRPAPPRPPHSQGHS